MTLDEAEALAKDVAGALTAQRAPMAEYDERMALFDLADRKGYDVAKARMLDHVRLIDPAGRLVVKDSGGAAFSYAEARRYLEGLPEKSSR